MKYKNYIYISSCFLYFYFFCICFYNVNAGINNTQFNPSIANNLTSPNFNVQTQNNNVNQNAWQNVSLDSNAESLTRQFNWQQRKVLKQKAYALYNNLSVVIEDINDIIEKFTSKVNNINQVVVNFNNAINIKCNSLDSKYNNLSQLINYIAYWTNKINEFKTTVYYSLHKDFRKKIDEEWQNFDNIKNMIQHYQNSISKMLNLQSILVEAVNGLLALQKKAVEYEERAWSKYQQLDELINDKIAENNFLEINNCSDNAILINTYLRTNFLEFFNQGMMNLNNANSLILLAIDDLINHINQTNLFVNSLETEIKVYDENKQKEKIALELQEKIQLENELKLKKEKEKAALQRAFEERSYYEKIMSYFSPLLNTFKIYARNVYTILIENVIYYYNLIFKKTLSLVKNSNTVGTKNSLPLSSQVSEAVSHLPPLIEGKQDVVLFTSPNNQVVDPNAISPLIANNTLKTNFTGIPGETTIDDVFSISHPQANNKEKIKEGASSYPQRVIPFQNQMNKNNAQEDPNASIPLLSSEDIIIPEQSDINTQDKKETEKISFKYRALENNNENQKNDEKLLPDLSLLEQSRVSTPSMAGIEQGQVNQVFQATTGSYQLYPNKQKNTNNDVPVKQDNIPINANVPIAQSHQNTYKKKHRQNIHH